MSRAVSFVVGGEPVPQGSKGVTMRGGKPRLFDTNATPLRHWRKAVTAEAEKHRVTWILQSPLYVRLTFQLPIPKTRAGVEWAPVKPDIDKLTRAVLDALVDGHVLVDDAQVVELRVRKRYGQPGVAIYIDDIHHHYERQSA